MWGGGSRGGGERRGFSETAASSWRPSPGGWAGASGGSACGGPPAPGPCGRPGLSCAPPEREARESSAGEGGGGGRGEEGSNIAGRHGSVYTCL